MIEPRRIVLLNQQVEAKHRGQVTTPCCLLLEQIYFFVKVNIPGKTIFSCIILEEEEELVRGCIPGKGMQSCWYLPKS